MANILVCDDDRDIVAALKIYLTGEGHNVIPAHNGEEALEAVRRGDVQLVLLDVMMPRLDGIAATTRIREISNVPIILLTAKSEDTDKVLGLTIGADDYVTKPFNPIEVLARVKSQLRRYTLLGSMPPPAPSVLRIGGVELDDESKVVTVDGEPVPVTPIEYSILKLLMENPGRVFPTHEIYSTVWQEPCYGAESTVAVHIRHLREKIEINPSEPKYVHTKWGVGYYFQG